MKRTKKPLALLFSLLLLLGVPPFSAAGEDGEIPDDPPAAQWIETLALSGVIAPERDASPVTGDIICETEGAVLESAVWEILIDESWLSLEQPFAAGETYRIVLSLSAQEGFAFSQNLTATVNGEDAAVLRKDETAVVALAFDTPALPFFAVRVTDGVASVNGRVIHAAQPGTTVQVRASILPEDLEFDRWVVTAGDVEIRDETSFYASFVMPEGDVAICAAFVPKTDDNACAYCGKVHRGFFGRILSWFHNVLQYFRELRT